MTTLELKPGCMAKLRRELPERKDPTHVEFSFPTFPAGTMGMIIRLIHSRIEGPLVEYEINETTHLCERENTIAHFKIGSYSIIPIDVRMLEPT